MNLLDRAISTFSPRTALRRVRARTALQLHQLHLKDYLAKHARHYEAASIGRRTQSWPRNNGDANSVVGAGLDATRRMARDLVRNNAWARRGINIASDDIVGWGIYPRAEADKAMAVRRATQAWEKWAMSTQCDYDGRLNFYGLMKLALRSAFEGGECLVRRRRQPLKSGMAIPLKLQLLEADHIDTSRDYLNSQTGNQVIQGIEYNDDGTRAAYWLYDHHPGAIDYHAKDSFVSHRIPASDVSSIYDVERVGQVRGITAFAPLILRLREFDEWEDADLVKKKVEACFAAFVIDAEGTGTALGTADDDKTPREDAIQPGMIMNMPPGRDVKFPSPPTGSADADPFTVRALRAVAAGLGITYESLTGDFSKVNFSSSRMARLTAQGRVIHWQWNVMIPQFCDPVWGWAMEQLYIAGVITEIPAAEWTPPALPYIDPAQEVLGMQREVRSGFATPSEAVRSRGYEWKSHIARLKADFKDLDEAGLKLDIDPRNLTQAGQVQVDPKDTEGDDPPSTSGSA